MVIGHLLLYLAGALALMAILTVWFSLALYGQQEIEEQNVGHNEVIDNVWVAGTLSQPRIGEEEGD